MPVLGNIELAANDGFHFQGAVVVLVIVGFFHKLEGAEHIAVIADGQRGHTIGNGFLVKPFDRRGSVEQRELRVYV